MLQASAGAPLLRRVFYLFVVLALLSAGISVGGKVFGRTIAMAGHTDDPTTREIVIGNDVLAVPSNDIRFDRQRRDGVAQRLDLYLRWPQMDGYSEGARDAFNNVDAVRSIVFLSFEERQMSRDMSGRFAPIYSQLIVKPGKPGPAGLTFYDFVPKSGYVNEKLAVAERPGRDPFVARCLTGVDAEQSSAPCERDMQVGENLSLTYRFSEARLADWQALDTSILKAAERMLRTAATHPR